MEAQNQLVTWKEEIPNEKIFNYGSENEEFLRNFSMPIGGSNFQGTEFEVTDDSAQEIETDAINAPNYVGMNGGLAKGDGKKKDCGRRWKTSWSRQYKSYNRVEKL